MAIKENKDVYVYSESIKLLNHFDSVNKASKKLDIPKSSLLSALDKREVNELKRTVRSKRIWSEYYQAYVILKSYELVVTRSIKGL